MLDERLRDYFYITCEIDEGCAGVRYETAGRIGRVDDAVERG